MYKFLIYVSFDNLFTSVTNETLNSFITHIEQQFTKYLKYTVKNCSFCFLERQ